MRIQKSDCERDMIAIEKYLESLFFHEPHPNI